MGPILAIATAYLAVAVLAIRGAAAQIRRLRPRRDEHLRRTDLALLWATAVLAGLGWVALAPVFAAAWASHRGPAALARTRRTLRVLGRRASPRRRLRSLRRRLAPAARRHAVELPHLAPRPATGGGPAADAWLYEICTPRR